MQGPSPRGTGALRAGRGDGKMAAARMQARACGGGFYVLNRGLSAGKSRTAVVTGMETAL